MSSTRQTPNESGPTLVAVEEAGGPPGAQPQAFAPEEGGGASRVAFRLVLGLLVLAGIGLAVQSSRVDRLSESVAGLEREVLGLEADVAAAQARIRSYDAHLSQARDSVRSLATDLAALGLLLERDPPGPAAGPPPEEPSAP